MLDGRGALLDRHLDPGSASPDRPVVRAHLRVRSAAEGRYSEDKLQDVSRRRRRRFFETGDGSLQVRDELRRLVIFDFHNLKHENGLQDLDVIFCRNVLIYFDPSEQRRVTDKLVRALVPGGYLFLGHSESLYGRSDEMRFVHQQGGTAYRKVEGEAE